MQSISEFFANYLIYKNCHGFLVFAIYEAIWSIRSGKIPYAKLNSIFYVHEAFLQNKNRQKSIKVYVQISMYSVRTTLRKRCSYSEFFWSVFSCIQIAYGDLPSKSPCSVQRRGNTDHKNSEYGHFLRSTIPRGSHHRKFPTA